MLSVSSSIKFSLRAAVLAALSIGCAHADVVTYLGVQGPKPDFQVLTPPALTGTALTEANAFKAKSEELGRQEFEGASAGNYGFNYTGGAASVIAGPGVFPTPPLAPPNAPELPRLMSEETFDPTTGRYNMTTGLNGANGKWIEARADFTITFSGGVTALSFFVTDLGDFDGQVFVDLYHGNEVTTRQLVNEEALEDAQGDTVRDQMGRAIANGNLLFFGATSDNGDDFTKAVFRINQFVNDQGQVPNTDYIGFDSIFVGKYTGTPGGGTTPEPASLALVGLALAAGGLARRRTQR